MALRVLPHTIVGLALMSLVACGSVSPSTHASGGSHQGKTQVSTPLSPPPVTTTPPSGSPPPSQSGPGPSGPIIPVTVNGCTTVDPFCVSSQSIGTCGCEGNPTWSHIYVGEPVPISGAVEIDPQTGAPAYPDIFIDGPGGWTTQIPVMTGGGFSRSVTFPEKEGWYQIGVVYQGAHLDGMDFYVPYVPHVMTGSSIPHLFPGGKPTLPGVVLAAPVGGPTTFQILFTDFGGHPARSQTFGDIRSITTDAIGVATLTYSPPTGTAPNIEAVYSGLFAQTYLTVKVSGNAVAWPPAQLSGLPKTVRTITHNGGVEYDVVDAIQRLDPENFSGGNAGQPSFSFDPQTGALILSSHTQGPPFLLETTGQLFQEICQSPECITFSEKPDGQVSPLFSGGQVYLDLNDLVTLLNAFAWASISPQGNLLFSDEYVP